MAVTCVSGAALLKAGGFYNSVLSGAGMTISGAGTQIAVDNWIDQAEAYVNVASKKNWTSLYPSLSDDVKLIIEDAVSSLAAINIIAWDMSGYTQRGEAESMINVLRDSANRNIMKLEEQKEKDFIEEA